MCRNVHYIEFIKATGKHFEFATENFKRGTNETDERILIKIRIQNTLKTGEIKSCL